jgi:hypothetical protein
MQKYFTFSMEGAGLVPNKRNMFQPHLRANNINKKNNN